MRLRSYIWPDNLPHNLKCQCGQSVTATHLLNCNRFISFRSKDHDSVRDQLYCMCKSYGIVSFLEPVLAGLIDDTDVDTSFGNSLGDVIFPGLDGSLIIADVLSIDVCNDSNKKLAKSNLSASSWAETLRRQNLPILERMSLRSLVSLGNSSCKSNKNDEGDTSSVSVCVHQS
ncbi:hypothetical protein GEMRC1_014080 [Eukaryota sp. GEM-RC1]